MMMIRANSKCSPVFCRVSSPRQARELRFTRSGAGSRPLSSLRTSSTSSHVASSTFMAQTQLSSPNCTKIHAFTRPTILPLLCSSKSTSTFKKPSERTFHMIMCVYIQVFAFFCHMISIEL